MAKRKIADLLKEAVEKSMGVPEEEGTPASPATSPSSTSGQDSSAQSTPTKTANDSGKAASPSSKRRRSPTKADLEATVATLTTQLETAQAAQADYQKKIEHLEHDINQQDALKAELAEAKKTILQLVDHNTDALALQEQIKTLQSELSQEKVLTKSLRDQLNQMDALKTELANAKRQISHFSASKTSTVQSLSLSPRPTIKQQPLKTATSARQERFLSTDSKFKRLRKASMARHQTTASKAKATLSDNEIGWFD